MACGGQKINAREKEFPMRRMLAVIMALGVAAVFGSTTLVYADCAYHKTQAGVDKTDPAKQVATAPTSEKADTNQVLTAQTDKPAQSAAEKK
jgi:hypothetical protein